MAASSWRRGGVGIAEHLAIQVQHRQRLGIQARHPFAAVLGHVTQDVPHRTAVVQIMMLRQQFVVPPPLGLRDNEPHHHRFQQSFLGR